METATQTTPPLPIPGPTGYPILGVLPDLIRHPLDFCDEAAATFGGAVRLNLGLDEAFLISHPDHIRHILIDHQDNYWKGIVNHRAKFLFGNGLIANDGEPWQTQRKMVQPAFHRAQLTRIAEVMVERVDGMIACWRQSASRGDAPDVARDVEHLNMDIVIRAMFQDGVSEQEVEDMGRAVTLALRHAQLRFFTFFLPDFVPLPGKRRTDAALRSFDDTVYRLIAERRRTGAQANDMLSMLLQARDAETGEGMEDRQLRDEMTTILTAASEAPALGIAWAWYLLAQYPEVEARLLAEVDQVLGGRRPGFEDLRQLTYTRRVYEEAMRLYPPVWMYFRQAHDADRLHDFELPAGAKVLLCPYITHRSPRYWRNPRQFDPDRFTPERAQNRHPFAYYPFGSGRRVCIGSHFAMMESQLILARVAQTFRLRPKPGHVPRPMAASGLRARNGIHMQLEPRRDAPQGAEAKEHARRPEPSSEPAGGIADQLTLPA